MNHVKEYIFDTPMLRRLKWKWFFIGFLTGILVTLGMYLWTGYLWTKPVLDNFQVEASSCKHENAECYWNNSQHNCCAGLSCEYWKTTGGNRRYKCEVTNPIPTISPVPTLPNGQEPTPTDEPEPTITPEPTEIPKQKTSGNSPEPYSPPEYKPSICSVSLPVKPTFEYSRISPTEVKVVWNFNDENTTHLSLSWGYDKDNLPYGALNIPKEAKEFIIGALEPNKTIWVEMGRWNTNDCVIYSDRIDP